MAGGSVFDDFTGDGLPDVFTSSFDVDLGASLFVNRGDGTFEDRSVAAGLAAQTLAVNASPGRFRQRRPSRRAAAPRRLGERLSRLSLLRNKGDGVFEDVTVAAGLGEPIASHVGGLGRLSTTTASSTSSSAVNSPATRQDGLFRGRRRPIALRPRETAAGSIATTATARSSMSPNPPASAMTASPRGRPGATTTTTAASTSTSRTSAAETGSTTTGDGTFADVAAELGVTEPRAQLLLLVLGLRQRRPARPLRQRLLRVTFRRPWPAPWAGRARAKATRGSTATSGPRAFATSRARSASTAWRWRWGPTSATSTTTAFSTSTSAPGCRATRP